AAVDAQSNLSGTYRWAAHAAAAGSFSPDNDRRRSYRANSAARQKNDYHLRLRDRRTGKASWRRGHARHATGAARATLGRDHAGRSVLSNARYVVDRGDESRAGSALSGLSGLRKIWPTHRPGARSDAF